MNIGDKMKNARLAAELTQEAVAAALGVSRQTVSNWENGKTYPDIVSVVKMSDLYGVSLDYLLKGSDGTPTYLDYLAESTDTVRSNDRKWKTVLISVYMGIWAAAILVFWFFTDGSDAMGYSLTFQVILLPMTVLVFSYLIGRNDLFGCWKWLFCAVFGVMYMLADYATFRVANMAAFGTFRLPRFELIPIAAAVAALGLSVGWITRAVRARKSRHADT